MQKVKPRYERYYFDLDGTITDSLSTHVLFCNDMNELHSCNLEMINPNDREKSLAIIKTPIEEFLKEYGFRGKALQDVIKAYNNEFQNNPRYRPRLFAGMEDLITNLRFNLNRFPKINLITQNTEQNAQRNLRNLYNLFHNTITKENLDSSYMGSKSLAVYSDLGGLDSSRAVVIGDTITDQLAANAAQCDFIAVNWGWSDWSKEEGVTVAKDVGHLYYLLTKKE